MIFFSFSFSLEIHGGWERIQLPFLSHNTTVLLTAPVDGLCIIFWVGLVVVLRREHRALPMLGQKSASEPYVWLLRTFFLLLQSP